MKQDIEETLQIPQGVTITIVEKTLTVKGPKGEIQRQIPVFGIKTEVKGNEFKISAKKTTKREKTQLYTTLAHTKNMIKGVQTPYKYTLKICSGHFPINASVSGANLIVKNFLGEKFPRTMPIKKGVIISVQGDKILVEAADKELAGQSASAIELLTAISNRDQRIFQDGIYIIEKAGEPLKWIKKN